MRKILTSVLSVAGLLAVVLALASSPASAAKEVVTIQTPADATAGNAGTYTVSWETQGGCDPGSGTSGASGSVTLTVTETTPGGGTGDQVETGVVTDDICNYSWKATFTNAAGAGCAVTGSGTGGALEVSTDGNLALTNGACATTGRLAVTVKGHGTNVGDCISAGEEATPDATDDCDLDNADADDDDTTGADTGTRRATADDTGDNVGAANATSFTITATPQKDRSGKVPEGCNAVSEDTETDYDDNNLQKATLRVADVALGGASCMYTVTAGLPAGFAAGDGSARSAANSQKNQDPATGDGPDGDAGSGCGTAAATDACADNDIVEVPDLTVSIAAAKVYLVQNVIGDAGGASASYEYKAPCGAPGLPGALTATPASGGISEIKAKTVVELRTGRFNVSEALPDGTADNGVAATALNAKGEACEATIAVSGVPAHCSVSSNSPASLASDSGSVIIEVTVDCSPPPAPEPPAEEPMDDTGDMGGDDMGGDDMGGDDMGGPTIDMPTG
ncbi:MAG: hypothetical protein OXI26_00515 [bacterium]|nr:hypothetical protein [bacterium]